MIKRRLLTRAMATAAIALTCTAAQAQEVTRIVAFGDSYADEGNFFQLAGIDPVSTVIYSTGRFTGGTNYVDTLGTIYDTSPLNFAIGGALTGATNTTPGLPGFAYEYTQFLAGGGGVFPTTSGAFTSGDLVTVSIGGNDARVYAGTPTGTVAGAPAAAAIAVTQASVGLDALVNAGAPTISFLAGNTALLPELQNPANYPDPVATAAIRQAYSNAFNSGIQTTLAGYAANGTVVHYLDLTSLLQQVTKNPGAYGFTNLGACAPIASCITDPSYASQYVFWVDGLHPTSHTSAIFAQYIATQLEGPFTLAAPGELGLETARQFGRTLSSRMDLGGPRDATATQGIQFFIVGDGVNRDVRANDSTDAFDIRDYGVSIGAQYGFGNGVVGIAGNLSRPKAKFTTVGETHSHSWQIGGFGAASFGAGFAQAYLGYGHDNVDIDRTGVVEDMSASPSGNHWLAGAKGGYLVPLGPVRVGPVVALDYAKAKVNSYTESGDAALTLNVGSASAKTLEGSIGAELRGNLTASGAPVRPFASAVLAKDFEGDGRTIHFAQTSAPIIVNSWQFDDHSKHVYGRLAGGLSADVLAGVAVDALISQEVGRDDGNATSAHIGFKVGF